MSTHRLTVGTLTMCGWQRRMLARGVSADESLLLTIGSARVCTHKHGLGGDTCLVDNCVITRAGDSKK